MSMDGKSAGYLASKPRYEVLDGLRGVAAILVVIFHCFETYIPVIGTQIINHGYLAVDFFFLLSGFVMGYAYDDRWGRMSVPDFFKRRLVRLHPMVIMGTLFGACLFFFEGGVFPLMENVRAGNFLLCLALALLMIPCTPGMDIRGWQETNPFNGPNWSLTYEYVGNILYALIFRRLPKKALAVLCVPAAFLTLNLTLNWDVFGLFDEPKFDVIGGWCLTAPQICVAFTRLLYPFICGLLISRILSSKGRMDNPALSPLHLENGFLWCSLMLAAIFCIPQIGGCSGVSDGLFQAVSIIAIFPFIIIAGAFSRTGGVKATKLCRFLGNISYPLYITHYPLIYMQWSWVDRNLDAPVWTHIAANTGLVLLAIGTAWAAFKLYDLPVRTYLTENWLKRKYEKNQHSVQ